MYINSAHKLDEDRALEFIKIYDRMALITTVHDGEAVMNQLPLYLSDGVLRGHLARANPVVKRMRDGQSALVTFLGPDAYVSPDYYPSRKTDGKVVPTWLYERVDIRGPVRLYEDRDSLLEIASVISQKFEANRRAPWTVSEAPPDFIERMLGGIIGIDVKIDTITGKAKLDQGEPAPNRAGVIKALLQRRDSRDVATAKAMEAAEQGRKGS